MLGLGEKRVCSGVLYEPILACVWPTITKVVTMLQSVQVPLILQ